MYSSKNLKLLLDKVAESGKCVIEHYSEFDSIQTGNYIWPNQLFNIRLQEKTLSSSLDKIEQLVNDDLIPQTLVCAPDEIHEKLIPLIAERGYKRGHWLAMTMPSPFPNLDPLPKKLEIIEIRNEQELIPWHKIVEEELMGGGPLDFELFPHLLQDKACYFFVGKIDGVAVTASMLLTQGSSAGIYLVATKNDYRGKGYGSAITKICIIKAQELAIETIHLQATQKGEPIYRKLGFKDCGRIELFKLKEQAES